MGFPRTDPELVIWLNNFANVFETHAETLGFTKADVTALRNDAAMLNYLVGEVLPTYKAAVQSRTAYKNLIKDGPVSETGGAPPPTPAVGAAPTLVAPGIVPRLRTLIQRIQLSPAYNQSIGLELGITSPDDGGGTSFASAKPTATAAALPGSQVRIEFVKAGFTGVLIESRRTAAEEGWALLATDNFSPYLDTRPPATPGRAEVREYRLRYLDRDDPVGDYSDIISASTTP